MKPQYTSPMQFAVPSALDYFAALVADDASLPLVEAALAVALVDHPQLDTQAALAELDALAHRLKVRLPADAGAMQRLRLLNSYFFQELGFAGNVNDYYDPENSYLHRVLESRRGIPITLAVLYVELATQIGLVAHGISFPGHFLVKVRMHSGHQSGEVVIDPFDGRSLSREALEERVAPYKRSQGLDGDFDVPLSLFLQAATPREIVARLLRNLKEVHRNAGDAVRGLAIADRLVVLLPDAVEERRDRAQLLAGLGLFHKACDDLDAYLQARTDAPDHDAMVEQLARWRTADRPPLH